MNWILALLITILIFNSNVIYGCDCEYAGDFLAVAPKSDLVALIKVSKYSGFFKMDDGPMPMSMEVEVIDVYGGIETRRKVTVWGDDGTQCRPYLSQFQVGEYYVIAFSQFHFAYTNDRQDVKVNDYSISDCGQYWLNVDYDKKSAYGVTNKETNTMKLDDLKVKMHILSLLNFYLGRH